MVIVVVVVVMVVGVGVGAPWTWFAAILSTAAFTCCTPGLPGAGGGGRGVGVGCRISCLDISNVEHEHLIEV